MRRFLTALFLFLSFVVCAQSSFEKGISLYQQADSCIWLKDGDKKWGISKYQEAQELFFLADSTYYALKCEARILFLRHFTGQLTIDDAKEFRIKMEKEGIRDSLLGYGHWLEGMTLGIGFRVNDAVAPFQKAIPLLIEVGSYDQVLRAYWMLAYGFANKRDREKSSRYAKAGLAIINSQPETVLRRDAKIHLTIEVMQGYAQRGDYQKAMNIFIEALKMMNANPSIDIEIQGYFFAQVGEAFAYLGDYERSYEFMKKAVDAGLDHSKVNFYALLEVMGRFDEAHYGYSQILDADYLDEQVRAMVLHNLADLHVRKGELLEAKKLSQRSIELCVNAGSEYGLFLGLINYSGILVEMGDLQLAQAYLDSARVIDQTAREVDRLQSLIYRKQVDLDSALEYGKRVVFDNYGDIEFDQGLSFSFHALISRLQDLATIYDEAAVDRKFSLQQESIEYCDQLHHFTRNLQEIYTQTSFSLSEKTAFIYEQGIRHSLLLSFNQGFEDYSEKAFQFSEWSKGHALQRAKKSADAKRQEIIPSELLELEYDLKIDGNYFRSQVSRFRSEKNSTKTNEYLARLEINSFRQDSLQSVFRNDYPRYYQLRYQDITLSVKEIQERLEPQQAFLEYYEGDTTSFLFVITPDNYAVHPLALHQDSLISELREFFQPETFEQPAQAYYDKAYGIYQTYLSPAIESLSAATSELIVVPDGKLSYVPFEVLLQEAYQSDNWSGPIPYLLRDYQIHYTYSAGLYFNEFTSLSSNDRFLAFAPDYATTLSDTVTLNGFGAFRNQITPLKYNREEVNYLQETFDGLGFVNESATERNFKQHLDDNAGILHLAMHTILDDEDPLQSRLIFTNTEDSVEDDQLHAYEIYNMRVPAQMTVLSACETGFGQLAKGEGALSLARAFAYAGSPSVVMSHWPVDDEVTAQVMQSFYDYLAEGYTKSEALRQAKLDYLDKGLPSRMHPFFWGSFVVMGDDTALALSSKWSWKTYAFWVLILSAVAVGMIRWIRPGFTAGRRS